MQATRIKELFLQGVQTLAHALEAKDAYTSGHSMRVSRYAVATAILSYNGRLFFGVTGDAATTPDVDVLADATAAAVGEMRDQVGATSTR